MECPSSVYSEILEARTHTTKKRASRPSDEATTLSQAFITFIIAFISSFHGLDTYKKTSSQHPLFGVPKYWVREGEQRCAPTSRISSVCPYFPGVSPPPVAWPLMGNQQLLPNMRKPLQLRGTLLACQHHIV